MREDDTGQPGEAGQRTMVCTGEAAEGLRERGPGVSLPGCASCPCLFITVTWVNHLPSLSLVCTMGIVIGPTLRWWC